MTWPIVAVLGTLFVAIAFWAVFAYIAARGMKTEVPDSRFAALLEGAISAAPSPMRILLAIDGSAASVAAVLEVASCPLPPGSIVRVLYAIHSRLPVIPDFPPWAVTVAAIHGESIREQKLHAPEVLAAARSLLEARQPDVTIIADSVEGVPQHEILRAAAALGADRIVVGSHGRGRGQRLVLGSTAAAVAANAPCTVHVVRSGVAATLSGAHAREAA